MNRFLSRFAACLAASGAGAGLVVPGAASAAPVVSVSLTADGLQSVSCTSATACTAVGAVAATSSTNELLVERLTGSTWTTQTAATPTGALTSALHGVSCASSKQCVAVGSYQTKSGLVYAIAETWNGSKWAVAKLPFPSGSPQTSMAAVSCASTSSCVAVGFASTPRIAYYASSEVWNGSKWTTVAVPLAPGGTVTYLNGVSCTSSKSCLAVGYYVSTTTGKDLTLVESWNGSKWTVDKSPSAGGASATVLESVSCFSATACTAVGYEVPKQAAYSPVALSFNGKSFALSTMPDAKGATSGAAFSVSCSAAKTCSAVGDSISTAGHPLALAEAWNGTQWTLQTAADPTGLAAGLLGVSCTSSKACVAAGAYAKTAAKYVAFAETWNGSKWAVQITPN